MSGVKKNSMKQEMKVWTGNKSRLRNKGTASVRDKNISVQDRELLQKLKNIEERKPE